MVCRSSTEKSFAIILQIQFTITAFFRALYNAIKSTVALKLFRFFFTCAIQYHALLLDFSSDKKGTKKLLKIMTAVHCFSGTIGWYISLCKQFSFRAVNLAVVVLSLFYRKTVFHLQSYRNALPFRAMKPSCLNANMSLHILSRALLNRKILLSSRILNNRAIFLFFSRLLFDFIDRVQLATQNNNKKSDEEKR